MCPESIPRIWLHPPAVAVGNTFQIGNHLPVSRLCSLGGCLLSFFPLAPVPLSTCFCSFVLLSSFPFSFFFCPSVLQSSFPFSFFSVLLSFRLPSRFPPCFCPSVPIPFPPALYNIIRLSPRRRAFGALDSCQERRKVHDFCKIICRPLLFPCKKLRNCRTDHLIPWQKSLLSARVL